MGNFDIKSKSLRCEKCFSIRRITIEPKYPFSELQLECRCGGSRISIHHYLSELGKGEIFRIKCHKCRREEKSNIYCYDCKCIYCTKCLKDHNIQYAKNNHKLISPKKFDFYCVDHQNELYSSYCFNCEKNICNICIQENKHLNHRVASYKSLCLSKSGKEKFNDGLRLIKLKLEYNSKVSNLILKKTKSEKTRNKIGASLENNIRENKAIMHILKFLIHIFNNTKNKNYNIIYNFVENINFNVRRLKFAKNTNLEEDTKSLINYLNSDLILYENTEYSILDNSKIIGISEINEKNTSFISNTNRKCDTERKSGNVSTILKNNLDISGDEEVEF